MGCFRFFKRDLFLFTKCRWKGYADEEDAACEIVSYDYKACNKFFLSAKDGQQVYLQTPQADKTKFLQITFCIFYKFTNIAFFKFC